MGCPKLTYEPILKVLARTENPERSREGKSCAGLYQYKYNGKELQDELELNWTSMDFRNYDPALGRFHVMDPLSDLAPMHNPYRFGFNNPVYWRDPTGLIEFGWDDDGNVTSIKTSNQDEINAIMGFFKDNEGASLNDLEAFVFGVLNSGGLFSEVGLTNDILNMLSTLLTIRTSEGHGTPVPYNSLYGGETFDSYDQHPNIEVSKWGKRSTAAGAYQFLSRTWDMHSKKLGLSDFSPFNQDRAAIAEIGLVRGATDLISKGDYVGALNKLSGKWTSLPGGVHEWKGFTYNIFLQSRATILDAHKK